MVDIKNRMERKKDFPFVSAVFVILNVIVFLVCTFTGDLLYNMGSVGVLDLLSGEFYRLLTSLFLHADIQHLVNNMLIAYGIGYMIEKEIGHFRFAIYYLVSGVFGSLFSAWIEVATGDFVSSIGASGAVFGLNGVLLAMVLLGKRKMPTVTLPRLLFMIGYSLYSGFVTENINNAAHIGGLVCGFFLAMAFCMICRIRGMNGNADGRTEEKDEY